MCHANRAPAAPAVRTVPVFCAPCLSALWPLSRVLSLLWQLVLLCMMYSAPSDGPVVVNPIKVVSSGCVAAFICMPAVLVFSWCFQPIAFVRLARLVILLPFFICRRIVFCLRAHRRLALPGPSLSQPPSPPSATPLPSPLLLAPLAQLPAPQRVPAPQPVPTKHGKWQVANAALQNKTVPGLQAQTQRGLQPVNYASQAINSKSQRRRGAVDNPTLS